MELVDQWTGSLLPDGKAFLGRPPPEFLLDAIDFGNALQGVLRDRGIAACIDEAASQVSPTKGLRDAGVGAIILAELIISLPGIDL